MASFNEYSIGKFGLCLNRNKDLLTRLFLANEPVYYSQVIEVSGKSEDVKRAKLELFIMEQVSNELLQKTIGEMSAMEFIRLMKVVNESISKEDVVEDEDKYVYGIAGIAEIFHCSLPTANRIKKGGTTRLSISGRVPWQNQESHHPDWSQDHCGQEVGIRTGWSTSLSAQRHVTLSQLFV